MKPAHSNSESFVEVRTHEDPEMDWTPREARVRPRVVRAVEKGMIVRIEEGLLVCKEIPEPGDPVGLFLQVWVCGDGPRVESSEYTNCWLEFENPEHLGNLIKAMQTAYRATQALGMPCVSGSQGRMTIPTSVQRQAGRGGTTSTPPSSKTALRAKPGA